MPDKTYRDEQIIETGRAIAMAAGNRLLALLEGNSPSGAADLIDSYANAVVAGTTLFESVGEPLPEELPA